MLKKILFVATYDGMREMARQVMRQRGDKMEIVTGELFEAVKNIQMCDLTDKEVIISRGGTARLLRQSFGLPVVEVEVCAYDILRVVYKYKDRRIAVIGADNVISGVKILEEVMGTQIYYFPFTFEEEIERIVDMICDMNIDIVVGDTVAVRIAKHKGLAVELVKSGKEAVEEAIDKAEKICAAILQEREKNSRVNAIVEHLDEGIIVTDQYAKIVLFNHVAENLLQTARQDVLDTDINLILPAINTRSVLESGQGASQQIMKAQGKYLVANTFPIWVENECKGVAITCEDVTEIQELEQKIRRTLSKKGLIAKHHFEDIIGTSAKIRETVSLSQKYASVDSTVFIYGESGTGKELFAQSIHNNSKRKKGPFIAINCATLPAEQLENTLFGYVDGAFAGAKKGGKKGVFEIAHNGTLFLDEIAELDLAIQSKILRVLQEREVMRMGGDSIVPVNVRIIAASNKILFNAVSEKKFREDLYYRISVLNINIPPLRERVEDVPLLVEFFIKKYCRKYGLSLLRPDASVLERLCAYGWPGNVRQLENVVQKMVLLSENGLFRQADMDHLQMEEQVANEDVRAAECCGTLAEMTQRIVLRAFKEESFNKTRTAQRLGITRVTLNKHLSGV